MLFPTWHEYWDSYGTCNGSSLIVALKYGFLDTLKTIQAIHIRICDNVYTFLAAV